MIQLIQSIFFPKMKVPVKKKWRDELDQLGQVKNISIPRKTGHIKGLLLKPKENAKGVAILAHPISKRAKYFFVQSDHARMYLDAGYEVLLFDFNGFGESDSIDFFYWKDTEAVIEWVKNNLNQSIILHGISFGSFHTIRATLALPPGSTVVLENTSRSLYDYWKRWWHTRSLVVILQKLPIQAFRDMNVLDFILTCSHIDINYKLIACENDDLTPLIEMWDIYDAILTINPTAKWHVVPGAAHLMGLSCGMDEYKKIIFSN